MGQLFSQQAAPRSRLDRSRNLSRSQRTRREVRPLEATTGNIQATSNIKASRREEINSSRKRPTSSVLDIRTNPYSSERVDGISGVPRHQSTYVRSKASKDAPRTKHHEHKSTRDVDDHQLAGRRTGTKDQKARSRLSRSDSHHTSVRFTKDCIVCTDTRSLHRFPDRTPTNQCTHDVDVCRRCLRAWIHSEFSTKIWNEINCPVCATRMQYEDISEFAPREVFHRLVLSHMFCTVRVRLTRCSYDKLATKAACESIPNFHWCLTKGCKSGQVQEPGNNKFRCKACNKSHCIEHGIAWHKRETCREYDYR
jgi:hypothetical protein